MKESNEFHQMYPKRRSSIEFSSVMPEGDPLRPFLKQDGEDSQEYIRRVSGNLDELNKALAQNARNSRLMGEAYMSARDKRKRPARTADRMGINFMKKEDLIFDDINLNQGDRGRLEWGIKGEDPVVVELDNLGNLPPGVRRVGELGDEGKF